jgi:Zn finger protein HypA/HybF involved in hydrogenase expression
MAVVQLPVKLRLSHAPLPAWVTSDDAFRMTCWSCRRHVTRIHVIAEWFVPWDSTLAARGEAPFLHWVLGVESAEALNCPDCGERMDRVDKGRY